MFLSLLLPFVWVIALIVGCDQDLSRAMGVWFGDSLVAPSAEPEILAGPVVQLVDFWAGLEPWEVPYGPE